MDAANRIRDVQAGLVIEDMQVLINGEASVESIAGEGNDSPQVSLMIKAGRNL